MHSVAPARLYLALSRESLLAGGRRASRRGLSSNRRWLLWIKGSSRRRIRNLPGVRKGAISSLVMPSRLDRYRHSSAAYRHLIGGGGGVDVLWFVVLGGLRERRESAVWRRERFAPALISAPAVAAPAAASFPRAGLVCHRLQCSGVHTLTTNRRRPLVPLSGVWSLESAAPASPPLYHHKSPPKSVQASVSVSAAPQTRS